MIVLDYRDSRPLYQQVKDSLRRMMLTGLLEPDEKLPSVRSLATQLAINPNTIQRAYAELEAEGYIYSVAGRGSFVSAGDGEHLRRIAELTGRLVPLLEELKSLGYTREQLLVLWEGGEGNDRGKNVVKTFDGFRALDDLTMTVPHGAVYGLVGPNGAGKSTIIRHLAGIYRQDSGDVLVDGQPVYENIAVKSRMAVIGDDWYYFPQSGIREMAKFLAGIYPDFSWERYEKLKQVFPLDEK